MRTHRLSAASLCLSCLPSLFAQPCPGLSRYTGFHPPPDPVGLTRLRTELGNRTARGAAIARMRTLGWSLLWGIIQSPPGCPDDPLWRTWPSVERILSANSRPERIAPLQLELQFPEKIRAKGTPPQLPSLSTVHMNAPAAKHIRNLLFKDPRAMQQALLAGRRDIPEFPGGSVTIKTFWRRVPSKPGGRLRLPIWTTQDERNADGTRHSPDNWISCVNVTVNPPGRPVADAPCIETPGRIVRGPFYRYTDFYHVRVTNADLAQLARLLPASERTDLDVGDVLVLIGLHIAAKQMPDWVWTTYWWKPVQLQEPADHAQRPPVLVRRSPWNNYAMNISLSMNYPTDENGQRPAVFNPYVEGPNINNGTSSNCMTCHSGAAFPENPPIPGRNEVFKNKKSDTRPGPPSNAFELHIRTDYVWSFQFRTAQH